jgi:hypothetical protein
MGACGVEKAAAMSINLSMCKSISCECYKNAQSFFGEQEASTESRDIVVYLWACLPFGENYAF